MPAEPVRNAAIDVLLRVMERNIFLDVSLDKTQRRRGFPDRGRRFLGMLVYGTMRHRTLCDFVLQQHCHQSLDKLPPVILVILRMAVFQALFCNQVTKPVMVHTSVDLAKHRSHAGLARMVNAVLRKVPETLDEITFPDPEKNLYKHLKIRYSMPKWLIRKWAEQFNDKTAQQLCEASNSTADSILRVNTLKTTTEELQQRLEKSGSVVMDDVAVPNALRVIQGGALPRGKWFQGGHFFLQDTASMLPALLMEPKAGERVLDMCAAPGGKTTHMAELSGGEAHIVAMDSSRKRLWKIQENVERLETPGIEIICGDALNAPVVGGFDRVLVDAPCSGLGTLRRHPDLKWRTTQESVDRMAQTQRALLRSAIGLCKNNGVVVYSVCTFTPEETTAVVESVLAEENVVLENGQECLESWKNAEGMYQSLPSDGAWDGFFLTRFRKLS
jgi:16S rRNA (cytosine967-C5)-methyltransferase